MNVANSINRSFRNSLNDVSRSGINYLIRGTNRKELNNYSFTVTKPRRSVLTCPFRYANVFATVAEILWVFSGRNDLMWLGSFLPSAYNYSDDGRSWAAGYGPRLRQFEGHRRPFVGAAFAGLGPHVVIDQIQNVVNILLDDPYSTQAVISIYSPDRDQYLMPKTKDTPCTMYLQFLIRDNKLDCICNMRSNDVVYGAYNINVVEWMFLQEVIVCILSNDKYEATDFDFENIKIGDYKHNAGSFHYYEHMFKRIDNILQAPFFDVYDYLDTEYPIDDITSVRSLNENLLVAVSGIEDFIFSLRVGAGTANINRGNFTSDYIYGIFEMCKVYLHMAVSKNFNYAFDTLLNSVYIADDLKVAALEFSIRAMKKSNDNKLIHVYDRVSKEISEKYKKFPEIVSYILGDWYAKYRI